MSQFDFGTLDPTVVSGTTLAADLNSWRSAVISDHSGPSAPTYAVAGIRWMDTSGTPYVLKQYDGVAWVTLGTLNATTHVWTPAAAFPAAAAAGVDTITATYSPALALTDKTICSLYAAGANTSTTPTFNPNSVGAKTITKQGGQALVAGDIPRAGFVALLQYDSANNRWELLNPATLLNGALLNVTQAYTAQHYPTPLTLTSTSNSVAFNNVTCAYAKHTLTENTTLDAPSNMVDGQAGELVLTGASTYTFGVNAAWKMASGVSVALAPAAGKKTWIWWECNGTYNYIVGTKQEA